jgi:hypothetical protein
MSARYTTAGVVAALMLLLAGPSAQRPDGQDLAGPWTVTLRETDGVELTFRMTFDVASGDSKTWEAYSREGAAREIVGGGQALLGSLFGKMPPRGALVHLRGNAPDMVGPAMHLQGTLESPFLGRREFTGRLEAGVLRGDLLRPATSVVAGRIEGTRDTSADPIRDYRELAAGMERTTRTAIFDPRLPSRPEFVRFFRELTARLSRARDDLDVVGAVQGLLPDLKTSHIGLIRNPELASRSLAEIVAGRPETDPAAAVQLSYFAPAVAHVRVTRWNQATAAVDRAFERMTQDQAQVLLLDIRGNPGGDHSSMAPFAHLVDAPATVGVFLGRKWYEQHARTPQRTELDAMSEVTTESTPLQLLEQLDRDGAVVARVTPRTPHFAGRVFVIVNGRTGSASEPLAHLIKSTRRGVIVGERTAGRMLLALPHPLKDGWVATLPVADFALPDGGRLEGRGVQPDVRTSPDEVFLAVADQIATALPYSSAALRGGSLEALKRPHDAARAYRQAIEATTRQTPPPTPQWRAAIHKRLARLLVARGDRAAALTEYGEVLKIDPNDAEALAAIRGGFEPRWVPSAGLDASPAEDDSRLRTRIAGGLE